MTRIVLALLVPASLAFAGPLTFGIKGGVPFTDAFNTATSGNTSYITHNRYWTVGPEVDVNLPFGLGIEVDALYRRVNFESTNALGAVTQSATTADTWSFPLLLKWKFAPGPGPIRPYVSVGPTFRGVSNVKQVVNFFQASTSTDEPEELRDRFTTGFTIGGGLQLLGHISPEIRYTRWGWNTFRSTSGLLKTNPDQLEFLVGLTF